MDMLSARIKRVTRLFLWGFLLMVVALGYWQVLRAPSLRAYSHSQQRNSIKLNSICPCDGELI